MTAVALGCAPGYEEPCIYLAAPTLQNPTPEFQPYAGCARVLPGGKPEIAPDHLEAASYRDGLAAMLVAGDWHYVRRDGATLPVLTYDNGPDPWSEGLVRSRRDDRIAYFNREFDEVVPPRYDWGWPFADGRALVCTGCRAGEPEGEHRPVVGGDWGYIDPSGGVLVPLGLGRAEARELGYARSAGEPASDDDLRAINGVELGASPARVIAALGWPNDNSLDYTKEPRRELIGRSLLYFVGRPPELPNNTAPRLHLFFDPDERLIRVRSNVAGIEDRPALETWEAELWE